jgi:hypothetical protein
MTRSAAPDTFVPRYPTLLAVGLLSAWVVLLVLPAFAGRFLVGPQSDQIFTGVPFRWFGAEEWHRTGHIPLWNPYMFGGLPFVGAMHGDIFYPTAWLRLVVGTDTALTLGFAVHLVLAGIFAYAFLRRLGISWTGSVTGGLAYQLSGIVASLVQPGHDGKLYVSALLPLILLALLIGIRERRLEGHGLLALGVALGILSPHIQMMQYTLILAGLFALYLAVFDERRPEHPAQRVLALGLALGAVALGFAAGMIQLWPFIHYMPYAARSAGAQGWEYATSYAIPPEHIVDWVVPEFTGILQAYWGSNFFKLHSEYVGAGTLVLAAVGIASPERRRFLWFVGGAWLLFVLVSLGGHTPFYRLWYAIVPGVKVTRAPGMAFFIPTFLMAVTAAVGVERLERGEGKKVLFGALVAAALLLLLGVSGGLAGIAEALAQPTGRDAAAAANADAITFGAVRSALVMALVAGLGLALLGGRLRGLAAALLLALLVGGDEFYNARRYFSWSPPASEIYADDAVLQHLEATPPPYRVIDIPDANGVYPTAFLMAKRVPNVLGHHGNELHRYDELLGGKNQWQNIGNPRLWDLLAVRFVVLSRQAQLPGFHEAASTTDAAGRHGPAWLYEADSVRPYARVIPAAVKIPEERIVPTLLDPRLDPDRVLLLPEDAPVSPPRITEMPVPSPSRATVSAWEPGVITVRLDPAPAQPSWLLVSENWYPDWHVSVDGQPATLFRGHSTFLATELPAGAREVHFTFSSSSYRTGRAVTLASLAGILLWIGVPLVYRRRRG